MGLSLVVGILADLGENDPEGADFFKGSFAAVNAYLRSMQMSPHAEPEACPVWSADMFGYSGLHYLRRIAAHVDSGEELPAPGGDDCANDPVIAAYFSDADGVSPRFWSRLIGRRRTFARRFDHLLIHGDAQGFYLPADFKDVLVVPPSFGVPGGMIGSAPRLLAELSSLTELLGIPLRLVPESEELWEAADSQGEGAERWDRYGVESYGCVVLSEACRRSIQTGAAVVFT
jgi:hypothetical protein